MVQDYINGIEWCIGYYLDNCPSWTLGYNFIIAPLIKDIINFFPSKSTFKFAPRTLNPVEQLILAIPPQTYKYVNLDKNNNPNSVDLEWKNDELLLDYLIKNLK